MLHTRASETLKLLWTGDDDFILFLFIYLFNQQSEFTIIL
jgi:hypothetical protein